MTYTLSDFLLFSERTYQRLFLLHNEALWPVQVFALLVAAGVFVAIATPTQLRVRLALGSLALMWVFVAWVFFWQRYATINWAAPYVAPIFVVQAVLLFWLASDRALRFKCEVSETQRALAVVAGVFAIVGYPAIAAFEGNWKQAEVVGLAPDPTVLLTMALLAVVTGRKAAVALVVPVLWVVITALTQWTLGLTQFAILPIFCVLLLLSRFRWSART
ncbi:MAG: DUF6064 family protein [Filomicrobium sp.]